MDLTTLDFDPGLWPILLVVLVTWGGVLFYMLRLDRLSKRLEDEVRAHETRHEALSEPAPVETTSLR